MKKFLTDSIGRLDLIVWLLVLSFFCGSSLLFGGNLQLAFIGASGIIIEMVLISLAIEIIIECLKNNKRIGTLTGFITNGPEAVCLLVGLVAGDIIFAASTPLGSNFMNPLLLFIAALITRQAIKTFSTNKLYSLVTICSTAILAASFFLLSTDYYLPWLILSTVVTIILFFFRPKEQGTEAPEEYTFNPSLWLVPAIVILVISGYFLDPVVSFAALHSHAPKGVIGFVVLATLTSWPEFKSCLVLLSREKHLAAVLNITVSNITNIWLAVIGIAAYFFAA